MANGRDTNKVPTQMREYCRGLDQGSINSALDTQTAVRIIVLFEQENLLRLVREQAENDVWIERYAQHFFFKSVDEFHSSAFLNGWHRPAFNAPQCSLF